MSNKRRTYRQSRNYSQAVMAFRQSVYQARPLITPMCQVLLLRLSDDMTADCRVSVPRSQLAAEFKVAPARITEWIKMARKVGFLDLVEAGRPGLTTTYHGLPVRVERVRPRVPSKGTPSRTPEGYESSDPTGVRPGVPQGYAQPPTHEVVVTTTSEEPRAHSDQFGADFDMQRGFEEDGCEDHEPGYCPPSCDNHLDNRRRTA